MFDQNDNRLLSLRAFSSASQPRFLQMWSNHFLHHYKASVLSLVALLSLHQDRPFCKYSQNHCTFFVLGSIISLFIFSKTN